MTPDNTDEQNIIYFSHNRGNNRTNREGISMSPLDIREMLSSENPDLEKLFAKKGADAAGSGGNKDLREFRETQLQSLMAYALNSDNPYLRNLAIVNLSQPAATGDRRALSVLYEYATNFSSPFSCTAIFALGNILFARDYKTPTVQEVLIKVIEILKSANTKPIVDSSAGAIVPSLAAESRKAFRVVEEIINSDPETDIDIYRINTLINNLGEVALNACYRGCTTAADLLKEISFRDGDIRQVPAINAQFGLVRVERSSIQHTFSTIIRESASPEAIITAMKVYANVIGDTNINLSINVPLVREIQSKFEAIFRIAPDIRRRLNLYYIEDIITYLQNGNLSIIERVIQWEIHNRTRSDSNVVKFPSQEDLIAKDTVKGDPESEGRDERTQRRNRFQVIRPNG